MSDNIEANQARFKMYLKVMVGMKFLLVTTLFLMRYLSLFIYCATQRIYLKTSRTIGRLKTCKN